jgi:hypothetical protein
LPEVEASKIPIWVTVPNEPPEAVNVISLVFEVVPPGELAASKVAD